MLAILSVEYLKSDRTREFYKLLAYLARYARQPWASVATMTTREMAMLADATHELVEEENKANEQAARRK